MLQVDRRNAILITVVIIVVAIVGVLIPYLQSRNAAGPNGTLGKHDVTIKYTQQGFDPQTVTVKVGMIVAWENVSGRPMWVGSDPHPSHTDLPGFDQKNIINYAPLPFIGRAFAHGQGIYEYKFTKVGKWGYHNHIYPQHRGTVIVTEK